MSIALRRPRLAGVVALVGAGAALAPAAAGAAPVTGTQTAVTPDPALVGALTQLGTTVSLTGAATADPSGRFVFPVTGGSLTPALKGKINHTGGIAFKPKGRLAFGIRTFVIDNRFGLPLLTAEPTISGVGIGVRVPVATLSDVTVAAAPPATVVTGTLKFTGLGAFYVNTFLGTQAVKDGTVFGQAQATVTLGG